MTDFFNIMDFLKSHENSITPTDSSIYNFLFYNDSKTSHIHTECGGFNVNDTCEYTLKENENETNLKIITKNSEDGTSLKQQSVETFDPKDQKKAGELKESTRKLLNLLDSVISKTQSTLKGDDVMPKHHFKPIQPHEDGGECSIYNRLTRNCQCLNSNIYNDFILKFNENVKHSTCDIGEIIKNMKILKKFLYMGDGYTRNALLFLKEGLTQSSTSEINDIVQGCIHSDICNVFEDNSVVMTLIIWPSKYASYGDCLTQMLTGILLYKLASIEDGNRYLNFNSKITHDIKNALKRRIGSNLNKETIETLNTTLYLLKQHFAQHNNVSLYSKPNDKDVGIHTLLDFIKSRCQMTISEVSLKLEILHNYSKQDNGKLELTKNLSRLLHLLKSILRDYDNSEINITAANLLNNVLSKSLIDGKVLLENNTMMVMRSIMEPVHIKDNVMEMAKKKKIKKHQLNICPGKNMKSFHQKGIEFYANVTNNVDKDAKTFVDFLWETMMLEKSKKLCDKIRRQTIIVPME